MIRTAQLHILVAFILIIPVSVWAQIQVQDDTGQTIILSQPARKIISLSPGLTELTFAAGGADYIKGVVNFSDYPEQAKTLPQIGSSNALDIEKIVFMQPDLVIAWKSGNPQRSIQQLKKLGLTVYISEANDFIDIPDTIERLGTLMATETVAHKNAEDFRQQFAQLTSLYGTHPGKKAPKTLIQIWNNPVMSVNETHLISKVITLCGGQNIFAKTTGLTNSPDMEAILQLNPDVIIATGMADISKSWLERWQQWPFLSAVKQNQLYAVNPDHLVRHTPRILMGIREVCQILQSASRTAQ
jgi:iron complex transport system substrate-binding protein